MTILYLNLAALKWGNTSYAKLTRVSGAITKLGNALDTAYHGEFQTVFIVEAGNNGDSILAFCNIGSRGDAHQVTARFYLKHLQFLYTKKKN